jgi:thioredoxin 2
MSTTETRTDRLTLACPRCAAWNRIRSDRVSDGPKCGKCGEPLPTDHPWLLTDESFARTIAETDVPVLVDFYADWCGPCKMMAPYVDELARERGGRALIAKLDTDRSPRTASGFGIRGVPTTVVFRNGREAGRQVGVVPKAGLERLLGD